MKRLNKILSAVLAGTLSLSAASLPAFALEASPYPEASDTKPEEWYLYGDANGDGKANTSDARDVLRIAAYMEPMPTGMRLGAADYDRDQKITSRDARLILRRAAKLDPPKAQPANPAYGQNINLSGEQALTYLRQANALKTTDKRPFTVSEKATGSSSYLDKEFDDSLLTFLLKNFPDAGFNEKEIFDSLLKDLGNEDIDTSQAVSPANSTMYRNYLQLRGDANYVISPDVPASVVSSAERTYDAENNTYTVHVVFRNESITLSSQNSPLTGVNSDIPDADDLSEFANLGDLGVDGMEVQLKSSFGSGRNKREYTMKNDVSNITISYTFNASTNRPEKAVYTLNTDAVIPATIKMKIEGTNLGTIRFAVSVKQNLVTTYDFK